MHYFHASRQTVLQHLCSKYCKHLEKVVLLYFSFEVSLRPLEIVKKNCHQSSGYTMHILIHSCSFACEVQKRLYCTVVLIKRSGMHQ